MALVATFIPMPSPTEEFEFYMGIPSRDLDEDDWAYLTEDQQALIESSPLYTMEV